MSPAFDRAFQALLREGRAAFPRAFYLFVHQSLLEFFDRPRPVRGREGARMLAAFLRRRARERFGVFLPGLLREWQAERLEAAGMAIRHLAREGLWKWEEEDAVEHFEGAFLAEAES